MDIHFKQKDKLFLKQIIKYSVVGLGTYLVDYIIFVILLEFPHIHYQTATFVGLLVGLVLNFIFSKHWVFTNVYMKKRTLIMHFVLVTSTALLLTMLGMWIFVDIFKISEYISKIVVSFLVFLFNFFMRKYVIFKN